MVVKNNLTAMNSNRMLGLNIFVGHSVAYNTGRKTE